ncbi:MAG TPA: DUF1015 domain-containing protein, partial [Terriglobia bacterium]|nr:DUF1015 domain-containing protein [Terriglobia bacterium]
STSVPDFHFFDLWDNRRSMADVYPFRGLCYSSQRVAIADVVTEPYDKISPEMRERYYARDPHNIVRIILGKPNPDDTPARNVYTRATAYLQDWKKSGVLQPSAAPAFWVYRQRYTVPGAAGARERMGFVGLGRIEDYASRVVFPHERTLAGPKADRLELLRNTRAHFEQIFMLYEDPDRTIDRILEGVAAGPADIQLTDERGVEHALWMMRSAADIATISANMGGRRLIIADGHHRYETALRFRDEMRAAHPGAGADAPFERMPMTFFNMDAPGLVILATHRIVARLPGFDATAFLGRAREWFDMDVASEDDLGQAIERAGRQRPSIGVVAGQSRWILSLKPTLDLGAEMPDLSAGERALDVVLLHRLLIERGLGITEEAVRHESHITYAREPDAAIQAVKSGAAQIAFLLNPTRIDQMRDIAYAGKVMPQKSTDFYPKVLSGLLIYTLD